MRSPTNDSENSNITYIYDFDSGGWVYNNNLFAYLLFIVIFYGNYLSITLVSKFYIEKGTISLWCVDWTKKIENSKGYIDNFALNSYVHIALFL